MSNNKQQKLPFSVSLVVPVYNNEQTVIKQLDMIHKILNSLCSDYEILIGDDYSSDKTVKLIKDRYAENNKFKINVNTQNLGIAKNLKHLYKNASKEYVALFSADGDWDPNDIKRLLIKALETKADLVIGERNKKKQYNAYRRTISYLYNFLPKILFSVETFDAGSIKVIKRDYLQDAKFLSKGVFFEAELIIRTKKNGGKITNCPINFKRKNDKDTGAKLKLVFESLVDIAILKLNGL